MSKHKIHLSKISLLHYWKLCFRSLLLLVSAFIYIYDRILAAKSSISFTGFITRPYIMWFIWVIFTAEMLLRFFPSQVESAGCQKVFARNYRPAPAANGHRDVSKPTWAILFAWMILLQSGSAGTFIYFQF